MVNRRTQLLAACFALVGAWSARAGDCAKLSNLRFGRVTVTGAQLMRASSPMPIEKGDDAPGAKADYCRVQATSRPSGDSEIRLELWIPAGSAWNGKFEQVGNGGFAGSIPYRSMARGLALGYAVAGTDDGHRSDDGTDASWALGHPQKLEDYGWRAIDETARASKLILQKLESKPAARSYFFGCSDGGREALMMAERFPSYFDGIVAGAPAFAMTRLLTGGALLHGALTDPDGHLGAAQLALLQQTALQRCGNGSTYLENPQACHIDLDSLACPRDSGDTCLSAAEIRTARAIYSEHRDPASGAVLHAQLPGAEAVRGSWNPWLMRNADKVPAIAMEFTWNYLAYMVMNDPKLDLARVTEADLVRGERKISPVIDAGSADLSAFKAHGGKLIQFHGWNDPAIPAGYSLEYRERLAAKTRGVNDFYRLYMVPGMLHCGGGEAPTSVDWLSALEGWVERGVAPAELVANGKDGTQTLHPVE